MDLLLSLFQYSISIKSTDPGSVYINDAKLQGGGAHPHCHLAVRRGSVDNVTGC